MKRLKIHSFLAECFNLWNGCRKKVPWENLCVNSRTRLVAKLVNDSLDSLKTSAAIGCRKKCVSRETKEANAHNYQRNRNSSTAGCTQSFPYVICIKHRFVSHISWGNVLQKNYGIQDEDKLRHAIQKQCKHNVYKLVTSIRSVLCKLHNVYLMVRCFHGQYQIQLATQILHSVLSTIPSCISCQLTGK